MRKISVMIHLKTFHLDILLFKCLAYATFHWLHSPGTLCTVCNPNHSAFLVEVFLFIKQTPVWWIKWKDTQHWRYKHMTQTKPDPHYLLAFKHVTSLDSVHFYPALMINDCSCFLPVLQHWWECKAYRNLWVSTDAQTWAQGLSLSF